MDKTVGPRELRALGGGTLRERLMVSADVKRRAADDAGLIETCVEVAIAASTAVNSHKCLFFFGNGGSSMDAGHLAAELLGRFYVERRGLPAMALADHTAAITAIGNDYAYKQVFARQIEAFGQSGDVAFGLSTSGASSNVVAGLEQAKARGMITVAMTGQRGGESAEVADYWIGVPSTDTPRIQECHMAIGHTICELVERWLN